MMGRLMASSELPSSHSGYSTSLILIGSCLVSLNVPQSVLPHSLWGSRCVKAQHKMHSSSLDVASLRWCPQILQKLQPLSHTVQAQFWAPAAAAAGVSLVMAYLNGVAIPDLLSLRTLIAKCALQAKPFFRNIHYSSTYRHVNLSDLAVIPTHTHTPASEKVWITACARMRGICTCQVRAAQVGGHMLLGERKFGAGA